MKGGVNTPPNLLSDLPLDPKREVCKYLGLDAHKIVCNKEQETVFKEIAENTNLELNADVILTDEQIERFKSKGIKIKLLETHTDKDGVEQWYKNGKLHRDNGPAVKFANKPDRNGLLPIRSEIWYKNGKKHRDDGPAVKFVDGTEFWYNEGQQHRDNGPAVTYPNGLTRWYHYGVRIPTPPTPPNNP